MSSDPLPFDICADLPSGTTVLEASAGTGKTYTIAALTARTVAEGAAELNELLAAADSIRTAADRLGVSDFTLRKWLRGQNDFPGER